jgi:hypothetical protein
MTPLRLFAGCVVGAVVVTAACAPITVTSFTERGVDLTSYRTFAWERTDTGVPGDPRLDNNDILHDYLRAAIDRQLIGHGYEPTTLQPDVYVHYHAGARQKVYAGDKEWTTGRCDDCTVEVYDEGTLLVDLTNARTGALVWRGTAESGLAGVVNRQRDMEKIIERVVGQIFATLPRRS